MKPAASPKYEIEDSSEVYDAPPPYELRSTGELLDSSATITGDGRFDISFSSTRPEKLAKLLPRPASPVITSPEQHSSGAQVKCPRLNIVIQVVGSRGDVQPFIAYGTALRRYGHRVRLATHNTFAEFVRKSGLEFYPIGGDPADLMSYMVRNPGIIPSLESMRQGDVGKKRRMIEEMLDGCWEACILPDPLSNEPFVANAIIANPPSFAHVHCAQALGVPAHIMFTMPWSATKAFPHPLANLKSNNMGPSAANWLSYGVVEIMTWQGLGDVINKWRRKSLRLDSIPTSMGPGITTHWKIPHTYCWSPAIIPKPADWGPEIDVCGFFLRDEPTYDCPAELDTFLRAGPPPVYVGFGSIVIDNPERLADIILEATARCGVRAIISRGWSKLGGASPNTSQVFYLGDCPHEWLFRRVSVVVHHGGAGTTACGLVNARPTIIVPFFGDQPFWGEVVASAGAGSAPIPQKELTVNALTEALHHCLSFEGASAAQAIAARMRTEKGVDRAVASFHGNLPVHTMLCDALPQNTATWLCKKRGRVFKLCDTAAAILIAEKRLKEKELEPLEIQSYSTDVERWDPFTGGASSVLGTLTDMTVSLGRTFVDPFTEYKRQRKELKEGGTGGSVNSPAGSAALAAGRGLGRVYGSMTKGTLVDLPLALAEGLRNVPRLYGTDADDYGKVTDWKSGTVVGGKALGLGLYNGVTGLATEPYKGMKEEGAVGFLKGVGKGSIGLVTKTGTATVGMFAYPAQGICKSVMSRTDHKLHQQRLETRDRALASADAQKKSDVVRWFTQTIR